jgi:hypothetical protein
MVAVSPSDQAGDFQYEAFSAMLKHGGKSL